MAKALGVSKMGWLAVVALQQVTLLLVFYHYSINYGPCPGCDWQVAIPAGSSASDRAAISAAVPASSSAAAKYKATRDMLSRELNLLKQEYAKRSCEMNDAMAKVLKLRPDDERNLKWSESGGWCLAASKKDSGQHFLYMDIAKKLSSFLAGKVVASFGDGPGEYKRAIDEMKQVKLYDAFDGAPYIEEVSENRAKFLDLSAPQYGMRLYDWVVCIEVAEHIPNKFETVFVDNIARHAKEGIILSWGMPGQPGLAHVNNQPFSHVKQIMGSHGFSHDEKASKEFQDASSSITRKLNLNVWRRTGKEASLDEA